MRSFAPNADFGTNSGAATSAPAARKSLRSILTPFRSLLSCSDDARRIARLLDHAVGHNPEIDRFDEFRNPFLYLPSPKCGCQLAGNLIQLVEHLCVLSNHHERQCASPPEDAMNFQQRADNVIAGEQLEQKAADH